MSVANVIGIKKANETDYGGSEAFSILSVSVKGSTVRIQKGYHIDETSLAAGKQTLKTEHETFTDQDVIDLIYNKYATLKGYTDEDLISTDEEEEE